MNYYDLVVFDLSIYYVMLTISQFYRLVLFLFTFIKESQFINLKVFALQVNNLISFN